MEIKLLSKYDLEFIITSLQFSRQRIENNKYKDFKIRTEQLAKVDNIIAKIVIIKKGEL